MKKKMNMTDVARLLISRWKADGIRELLFISAIKGIIVLPLFVLFVVGVWMLLKAIWSDDMADGIDPRAAQKQLMEIDPSYQYCVGSLDAIHERSCNIVARIGTVGNWRYVLKRGCTKEERRTCAALRQAAKIIREKS